MKVTSSTCYYSRDVCSWKSAIVSFSSLLLVIFIIFPQMLKDLDFTRHLRTAELLHFLEKDNRVKEGLYMIESWRTKLRKVIRRDLLLIPTIY